MITTIKNEFIILPKSKIKASCGLENGKYPFFTSSDIKISFLNEYKYDDEIVILGTGGKPSCNYINGKFSFSTDNYALKSNGFIKPKFLYYFLRKDNLVVLQKGFHGTGLKHIGKDYILDIKIPKYEEEKQKEIICNLDNINNLIEKKKNQLKLFNELIKSRFIEMFSEVSNKQMLSALTIKITDGSHNPPKGIEKSNYLMLSSQNVYDKLVLNDVRYLSKEDFNFENKRTNIQNGDVLLTIVGTVGRTYVVRNDEKYVFQRSVAVIKPIDGVLDGIYLSAYLKTEEAINQLEAGAHGSSQKGIYLNNLKKLVIPVADFSKQLTFKSFVNQVDKSKFIYHSKYFLCDIFTLFSSTIAYSSVVSIFACPNIFCTCSIGIPLSIAFVANVLLNLWGWIFDIFSFFPIFLSRISTPLIFNLLYGLNKLTNNASLSSFLLDKYCLISNLVLASKYTFLCLFPFPITIHSFASKFKSFLFNLTSSPTLTPVEKRKSTIAKSLVEYTFCLINSNVSSEYVSLTTFPILT